ncbi:hypothetical protein Back11_03600 [Paenibacillus baekrokdamisoli]|uniref:Uncharacterized protein n=1 Tax=Paenibacillus baekrokdamisoli TaxID=1712516 RepID=A0A3G9ISM1_9BACL|nr:hypothetical protein Back11_03600 [Paenibacillus baekrokdamisoli]
MILLWILTSLSWNVFDTCKTAVVLIFYLLAYIALRLPGSFSVLLAAAVISADAAIWLFTQQSDVNEILMYSIIHAGTYGFFWGARMRREANDYKLTFSDNFSLSTFSSPR